MKMRVVVRTVLGLALAGGVARGASGQEQVSLQVKTAPGQKLVYKNLFKLTFFTDRAKEVVATSGQNSYQIDLNQEWTQEEAFRADGKDTLVVATLTKVSDLSMINSQTITKDLYPWTLEDLNGVELSWRVEPRGDVRAFGPAKEMTRLTLATLVSDLRLVTEGDFYPPLPAEPRAVGESWTSERTASSIYEEFQNFEGQIKATSTLKIKGMKKKGARNCAEIEESRVVAYKGWLNTGVNALILEGEGKGKGTWLFDVENGIVVEHQIRMDIEARPTVVGEASQRNVETRLTIWVERKLEK
ncbi:MAG: hypothetical protein EXS64_05235 [Candidatus Latescibacteria bacterium]|nr:hypothetical protein [Candidatus Latescibacterota bacterium]